MHKFCLREIRFAGTCNVSFSYELRARKLLTCGAFGGLYGGTVVKWTARRPAWSLHRILFFSLEKKPLLHSICLSHKNRETATLITQT